MNPLGTREDIQGVLRNALDKMVEGNDMSVEGKSSKSEESEEIVDLDLKAEDARLREAIGKPTSIRINDKVIHIQHVADWSGTAMAASAKADWETWASEVIFDEEEAAHFIDADLANYQIEAVFDVCANKGGLNKGKSKRSRK